MKAVPSLPPHAPGLRVGLFGGSFNPVHEGHRLVVRECLRRLALDQVWVLVSPGNPLKDHSELAPLPARIAATRAAMRHPRIAISDIEAQRGFHYTFRTISFIRSAAPGVRFVWIMGADSLASFHHWERWQDIARLVPIAVYSRPGADGRAVASPAAQALSRFRLPEGDAGVLANQRAPAWVFLRGLTSGLSSTALRTSRGAGN